LAPKPQLVIFLRAPQRGAVKRRLGKEIGARWAHAFYAGLSRDVVRRLSRSRRWRLSLAVTPDVLAARARLWPAAIPRFAQGGGDLGHRMGRVFANLPPGPVVIVGTDIPGLSVEYIEQAFATLARNEAVFGPAADGGYWLIGLARRRFAPRVLASRLFRGVRWSSSHALADTRANLPKGAEGPPLECLEDVDDAASWRRARESSDRFRFR
jgi:rSAM/selenodomain-associated transferase 1